MERGVDLVGGNKNRAARWLLPDLNPKQKWSFNSKKGKASIQVVPGMAIFKFVGLRGCYLERQTHIKIRGAVSTTSATQNGWGVDWAGTNKTMFNVSKADDTYGSLPRIYQPEAY